MLYHDSGAVGCVDCGMSWNSGLAYSRSDGRGLDSEIAVRDRVTAGDSHCSAERLARVVAVYVMWLYHRKAGEVWVGVPQGHLNTDAKVRGLWLWMSRCLRVHGGADDQYLHSAGLHAQVCQSLPGGCRASPEAEN